MGMQDLLEKLQGQPKTVEEHFAEKKQEWIGDVAALMTTIESWLAPLVEKKVVRLEQRKVALDEPDTGSYEVDALTISISVLTPSVAIDSPASIEPGRDGVRLDHGPYRAVFLPEVASDHGWDRDELLRQLARKAGIPGEDWSGARLATFRAESFGE